MIVVESAIAAISLSLWEMMIDVMPWPLRGAHQVEQVSAVLVVGRRGGLVEDEQLHALGERLGDLDELLLADADVLDLGVGALAGPHPGEPGRLGVRAGPVNDPAAGAFVAEEMFSAMERCGLSASSWWMITMPRSSRSRIVRNSQGSASK